MKFEFLATGGVLTSMTFHTVKLLRYVNPFDYFVLACEIVYICFIIYYIIEETIEIRDNDFAYFKNFWNVLDVTVIAVKDIWPWTTNASYVQNIEITVV